MREPEKPSLVIENREALATAGSSAMLELVCKGYPQPEIIWKKDGKAIELGTKFKYVVFELNNNRILCCCYFSYIKRAIF